MKRKNSKNIIVLGCIFTLCAYGFWHNAQKQFATVISKEIITIDETQTVSQEDQKYLEQYQKKFRDAFGIELLIRIVSDLGTVDKPQAPSCIFIAIAPEQHKHVVYVSTLVNALIGKKNIDTYNKQYLQPNVQSDTWRTGLSQFLNALAKELTQIMQDQNDPQS